MPDSFDALFNGLKRRGLMIATAESCTGGLIAATLTNVPGSSAIFDRGFVTYSNEAKMELLKVQEETLQEFGAVSEQTAKEMVQGALQFSNAQVAVSVTGIAGPDGGTKEKPVGLVYIGVGRENGDIQCHEHHFEGDRNEVRAQTVAAALSHAADLVK